MRLSPSSAQFKPALYYQVFIPCDVACLVFQAIGGALSTQSNGSSKVGVNLGLAGLSLQVAVIFVFIVLSVQYAFRPMCLPDLRAEFWIQWIGVPQPRRFYWVGERVSAHFLDLCDNGKFADRFT
jgi:hypothetical protein